MPRNGSGAYTLPQAPFSPNTTISSASVNSDLSDIATAITGSIASDGQTPITAPLRELDGLSTAPSWSFSNDHSAGTYLPGTGEVGLVAGGFGLIVSSVGSSAATATPSAAGSGYVVNDTITLTGGTFVKPVILTVATLSGSGVATVTITDSGLYTAIPTNPVAQASTSGSGVGATFTMTWSSTSDLLSTITGTALWTFLGATSYMAGAMSQVNGLTLAEYIGAGNLALAIQSALPVVPPQGYLTVTSLTPVIPSDVIAATSIFYTPYVGNLVPIYNGTFFTSNTFSELTLTLNNPNHAINGLYDVFVFLNSGVVTLGTGPIWSNITPGSTVRGTGAGTTELQRVQGLWVNKNIINLRNGVTTFSSIAVSQATYLGTIYIDGGTAGQVTCHRGFGQNRKFGVWNAYNRIPIILRVGDGTASWTYTSGTIRASNNTPAAYSATVTNVGSGTASNGAGVLCGLPEEELYITFNQVVNAGANSNTSFMKNGVGINSTTAYTGLLGQFQNNNTGGISSQQANMVAQSFQPPFLGLTNVQCCESIGTNGATNTYLGTEADMEMSIWYMG